VPAKEATGMQQTGALAGSQKFHNLTKSLFCDVEPSSTILCCEEVTAPHPIAALRSTRWTFDCETSTSMTLLRNATTLNRTIKSQ